MNLDCLYQIAFQEILHAASLSSARRQRRARLSRFEDHY